jgi:signal transduction histidine kinase
VRFRGLPLQAWIVVVLAAILVAPLASVAVTIGVVYREQAVATGEKSRVKVVDEMVLSSRSWEDPGWQERMTGWSSANQVDLALVGLDGRTLYASPGWRSGYGPVPEFEVVTNAGGEQADLYVRERGSQIALTPWESFKRQAISLGAGLAALLAVLGFLLWVSRRYVLKPLEELTRAARGIEAGDLDVSAPTARVSEIDGVSAAFRNMSRALRDSRDRESRLEEQRRFVIAAIAHDLRTPLFSLRGYLEALENGLARSPDAAQRYARVCAEKALVLERRIAELFAFARLEYLERPPAPEALDLGRSLARSAADLEALAAEKDVAVRMLGPPEACVVDGDEELLGRAFENLLDNAIRHARPGGEVVVTWGRRGGEVFALVADDGPGIDPSDLPRIFEPLYRGEESRNRETGGTGLGLAITRRAVVAHEGRVEVRNREEGGAEFAVWLPAPKEPPARLAPAPPAVSRSA